MRLPSHFGTDNTSPPILHAGSRQGDTDQNDSDRRDEWRKDALDAVNGQKRNEQFEQTTDHARSEHSAIGFFSRKAVGLHLRNGNFKNGQERKACAHDGQDATSQVQGVAKELFRKGDFKLGNVDD
jgi:hypothetical protein